MNTAVNVLNRTGVSEVSNQTPYQVWFKKPADFSNMNIFGSSVYAHIPKEKRRKWDVKSKKGVFVGFRVWYENENKVVTVCDVIFEKKNN